MKSFTSSELLKMGIPTNCFAKNISKLGNKPRWIILKKYKNYLMTEREYKKIAASKE
jgi:hypothetical protein